MSNTEKTSMVGVLGASGYTGRLVVGECIRRGHRPIVIGRDGRRTREALEAAGIDVEREVADIRVADVEHIDDLRAVFGDLDVLLTTVGAFERLGHAVLEAAITTGTHYVDSTGEQSFMRWAYGERDDVARSSGVVAVPAAGFDFLPGDLLANLAAAAVGWTDEVHVAYAVRSPRGPLSAASGGTRRTIAELVDRPGVALDHGELVDERAGQSRRLAWFPRPVGPRHAAGIPGGEPITVPRHVPGVRTVRTYVAIPGWQAEALQFAGSLAGFGPARRLMTRALVRGTTGTTGPTADRRRSTRWGCVAEARGRDGVARAWAYGHDVYGLTAVAMVVVAEQLLEGVDGAGVLPPASLRPAAESLDLLATRSDLRWSIARPDDGPESGFDASGDH